MPLEDSYLGRGWSFPPSFTPPTYSLAQAADDYGRYPGGVAMVSGVTDIEQSLYILFTTRLGERILAPDYGGDLHASVFETLDATVAAQLEYLVQTAVLYHEPRIRLLGVTTTLAADQPGLLLLELAYQVRNTNSRHNYVYPFYLQEGSELRLTDPAAAAATAGA